MFTYVVLHYMSTEMTADCVNHMLRLSENSKIVIVDNCSPNGSGEQLRSIYNDNPRVHVIINSKNEGFARGNNIGYTYAKKNFNTDYIVVSNNDVIITQEDFEKCISSFLVKNNVDVCGPDIITPDGFHQNPLSENTLSTNTLRREILLNKIKLILFSIPLFFNMYAKYRKRNKVIVGSLNKPVDIGDCVLHGAFIIFSRKYFSQEPYAFLPVTYMYSEEFVLYDYLKYKGYKTAICSNAQILHLGGKSTTKQWGDIAKIKFRFKHTTDSLIVLLKLRNQYINDRIYFKE